VTRVTAAIELITEYFDETTGEAAFQLGRKCQVRTAAPPPGSLPP
jgi:hypothetical protein